MLKNQLDNNMPDDPRFHSPDDTIKRYQKMMTAPPSNSNSRIMIGDNQFFPPHPDEAETDDGESRYRSEIRRWHQYEQDVLVWRDRVLTIVKQLKAELNEARRSSDPSTAHSTRDRIQTNPQ